MGEDCNPKSEFARAIMEQKYSHVLENGKKENWAQIAHRVCSNVFGGLLDRKLVTSDIVYKIEQMISEKKFMPGGRYLYAAGRPFHQVQNCILTSVQDSRAGWAEIMHNATMGLMSGAGLGVVYSGLRPRGAPIAKTGGISTGPTALMQMINEAGRGIIQGGQRRSAIWAGLHWNHGDVFEFIHMKDWSEDIRKMKEKDYNSMAPMDSTNISVILDDLFFEAYSDEHHALHELAVKIYTETVSQALRTGDPGFSIDIGSNAGEHLRNACTEITSKDDSDICNLGSINMAKISSLEDMSSVVELSTIFLLAGTLYSDVPYDKVDKIRTQNRRLGLGLMGLHEWLLKNGKQYGPDEDLEQYLKIYATSGDVANTWADAWQISRPIKTRAIAPTGTIGIVAETTTGIEPIFCIAFKRRYIKDGVVHFQYVVDPTAQRLIDSGISEDKIEDAYKLSEDVERRLIFQSWLQQYVDHAISSTINMPSWDETNSKKKIKDFGNLLMKYLPKLRGITIYPDGARFGQPLTPVKFSTAIKHVGEVFVEQADICDLRGGASCGA